MRAIPTEGTLSKRGKSFEGVRGNFYKSFPEKNTRKTNFRERLAVVGPSRLRELLSGQRTRVRNPVEFVLHQRFYQAQSMKKGTDMRAVPTEGALSKRGKSFEGCGELFQKFPTKNPHESSPRKIPP